jgi:S-formylglutathione hydrolase FrmB
MCRSARSCTVNADLPDDAEIRRGAVHTTIENRRAAGDARARRSRHRRRGLGVLAAVLSTVLPVVSAPVATGQPPQGAHITGIEHVTDRWDKVSVFSPSMNKVIVNDVYRAPEADAPVFYLLPGIDGGDDIAGTGIAPGRKSWFGMTDIPGFFADKNVNVVSPLGGAFSWYTDWVGDPGKQYQTYMTRELPPLIDAEYKTNGRKAVGGLSSTGGTALDYAVQAPGAYRAVGSYSGFLTPADNAQQVQLTLMGGGASAEAMWGPLGGPLWVAHDPTKNVAKLNGVAVYVAASAACPPTSARTSPVASSNESSPTAPGSSPTRRRRPVCPSPTSCDPTVLTPGVCSNPRCRSRGTPPSDRRWRDDPRRQCADVPDRRSERGKHCRRRQLGGKAPRRLLPRP